MYKFEADEKYMYMYIVHPGPVMQNRWCMHLLDFRIKICIQIIMGQCSYIAAWLHVGKPVKIAWSIGVVKSMGIPKVTNPL